LRDQPLSPGICQPTMQAGMHLTNAKGCISVIFIKSE